MHSFPLSVVDMTVAYNACVNKVSRIINFMFVTRAVNMKFYRKKILRQGVVTVANNCYVFYEQPKLLK